MDPWVLINEGWYNPSLRPLSAELDWVLDILRKDDSTLRVLLPKDANPLPRAMRQELRGMYIIGSWDGIDSFAIGVFGLSEYGILLKNGGIRVRQSAAKGRSALFNLLRDAVSAERKPLWDIFENEREALLASIDATVSAITAAAVLRAVHVDLPRARDDALSETRRYFSLVDDSDEAAKRLLEDRAAVHAQLLIGPEGKGLRDRMISLRASHGQMRAARSDFLKIAALESTRLTSQAVALLAPLWSGAKPEPAKMFDALFAARRRAAETGDAFAAAVADAAKAYPIIFRLSAEVGDDEVDLAMTSLHILQDAWAASFKLADNLRAKPDLVWKLPALIDRTVEAGFDPAANYEARLSDLVPIDAAICYRFGDGFSRRVAADHLASLQKEVSYIQAFNYIMQGVSTVGIAIPIPPAEAAIMLVATLTSVAEAVESYIEAEEQKLAGTASIDPSRALGSVPSLASLVIQSVFLALCILPVPSQLKALAKARRAAT